MCPDRQMISLYYDDELPSPWKEKMALHLESCHQCRGVLAAYQGLGATLKTPNLEHEEAAQQRIWKTISAQWNSEHKRFGNSFASTTKRSSYWHLVKSVLSRTVSIPIPLVAAATVFVIFALLFSLANTQNTQAPATQNSIATMRIGFDDYTTLPIQNMDDVLHYLSTQDDSEFTIIKLPEYRSFSRTGEPMLINASDHRQGRGHR